MVKGYFIFQCDKTDIIFQIKGVYMSTLQKDIENFMEDFQKQVSKDTINSLDKFSNDLKESNIKSKALQIGEKIPEFTLSNQDSKIINIKEIVEKNKYTVINFFKGSWSPFCNIQLNALQRVFSQLKILNTTIISISPQTPDKSLYVKNKYSLDFPILFDKNNTIAKDFKIVYSLNDEIKKAYNDLNIDILEANRNGSFDLPLSSIYIVNKNYEIIYSCIEEDYKKRCEAKEIINEIKKDMLGKK